MSLNKKIKIDDSNNNNSNNNNEIDILNLNKQTVIQLKSIADSLGILIKSGIKKNDIIEQIKIVYSRKQELLKQVEVESNLNSFNKDIVEFKIKDGIDNLEWLFWKIFRNKFIYKKIMSFMDTVISPSYESLISVDKMISLKQFEILRDKVLNNKYLVFSNQLLSIIYSSFKNDNDQDRLFYKQLFKYYGQYSLDFNNICIKNSESCRLDKKIEKIEYGRNDLVIHLIELDCIPAVKVLIEEYQYKPTINDLKYSINIGKLKFIKLFLQPKFNLNFDFNNNKSYDIKVLNHFFNQNLINESMLENNLYIKNNPFDQYHPMTLNSLIKSCKLIFKSKSSKISTKLISNLSEIESFSNSLTRDELKLELIHEKNQIKSRKQMIIKLLDFYYQFMKIEKLQFHYIYFNEKDHWEDDYEIGIDIKPDYSTYLSAYKFGNYKIIKKSFDFDIVQKRFDFELKLFSHCTNDFNQKEKLKFINFIFDFHKDFYVNSEMLYYLLISYNDLKLIKHVTSNPSIITKSRFVNMPNEISKFIQSKQVLQWIFNNHFEVFFKNSNVIWYFKNVELLKHCELLYKKKFNNDLIDLSKPGDKTLKLDIQVLKHILKSGSSIYKINNNNYCNIYTIIFNSIGNSNEKLELCKLAYLNFNLTPFSNYSFLESFYRNIKNEVSVCFCKFIDWLYTNYKLKFEQSYFEQYKNNTHQYNILKEILNIILFKIGRFNDIDLKFNTNLNYLYRMDHGECIEQINYILKINSNSLESIKNQLYSCLEEIIKAGRLKSIIQIHQNHKWLFTKKSTSNSNGLFTIKELTQLLAYSLKTNNLKVSEFLFEILSITKKEFENSVTMNDISFVYFNNKSNSLK